MERKLLKLECLLKTQMQDPEDACKALMDELDLDVDEERQFSAGSQMQHIVRDSCFSWCRARKAEGHGHQVQKLSWRLLCREAVVRLHYGVLEDIMQWVQVVVERPAPGGGGEAAELGGVQAGARGQHADVQAPAAHRCAVLGPGSRCRKYRRLQLLHPCLWRSCRRG
jgi:hypothetical protein